MSKPTLHSVETLLTWVAPPLVVPALRFFQDPPESRVTLFARDFATYSLGAGLFFLTRYGIHRFLQEVAPGMPPKARQLMAFLGALAINLVYAGVGAVQLSQWLTGKPGHAQVPTRQPDTVSANRSFAPSGVPANSFFSGMPPYYATPYPPMSFGGPVHVNRLA